YALLSLGQKVLGVFAHATHFVLLPVLAGVLLLPQGIESGRLRTLFWSGILLGLGFLMKQHGVFFVLFGLFYVASEGARRGPRAAGALPAGGDEAPLGLRGGLPRLLLPRGLSRFLLQGALLRPAPAGGGAARGAGRGRPPAPPVEDGPGAGGGDDPGAAPPGPLPRHGPRGGRVLLPDDAARGFPPDIRRGPLPRGGRDRPVHPGTHGGERPERG